MDAKLCRLAVVVADLTAPAFGDASCQDRVRGDRFPPAGPGFGMAAGEPSQVLALPERQIGDCFASSMK
jgi:hypothetical protein